MLKVITDRMWGAEDKLKNAGVHFDVRMVVIQLESGGLFLHSPIAIDDKLAAEIALIGEVEHIVAPTRFHHLWLGAAAQRYPNAKVWGCRGMAEQSTIEGLVEVEAEERTTWAPDLQCKFVDGNPRVNELVFLHPSSKTLVVCDLIFHMKKLTGLLTPLVFALAGTRGRFAQSRLWRATIQDRAATQQSVREILEWDFERVVMSHGEIVHDGGKDMLVKAMRPLLGS
ncbi:MAG: DUF4336 domain-containing protein [Deltaproteobacteria bacterium]|nr:DUF4336 domain-containing protein [Deltaproteobacteria bacterium]